MSGIRETERTKRQVSQNISDTISAISEKRALDSYLEAKEDERRDKKAKHEEESAALLVKEFNRIADIDFSDKKSLLNAINQIYRTYTEEDSINSGKSGYGEALKFGKKKYAELITALMNTDCDVSIIERVKKQYNSAVHPNRIKFFIWIGIISTAIIFILTTSLINQNNTDPSARSKKIEKAIAKGDLDKGLDLLLSFSESKALSSCDGPKQLINELIKKGDIESAERIRTKCPQGYGEYFIDYYIKQGDFETARKCIVFEDYVKDYTNDIKYYDATLYEHYVVQYARIQVKEGVPKNKISSQLNADLKEVLIAKDYYYLDKRGKEQLTKKQLNKKLLDIVYNL